MAEYQFSTLWRVNAPLQVVWDVLYHPDRWPDWWKSLEQVTEIEKGDIQGIGALHRYTWKGVLPYRITFDIHVITISPLHLLEGQASGEVEGIGLWTLFYDGTNTIVRYDWQIRTNTRWMNYLAPIAAPLFRWNHDRIMREGAQGLARILGAKVDIG
ncbi:SRPBCC family protein [Yersinia vastinensis]|uniref:SRPBCC family protein n=1 Tax=Yersinia vastinensis TaxID=2890318 RepID=UPI0005E1091C|nr:SRPBCC family protein [Yersinia vastinensis]OVZ99043.1 polyketide cyclase [Yersinia frederiksenii]CNI96970.1 Polyketide cyclase / dehydrase and lipid transport [Yersinia frederiksenii]